MEVGPLTLSVSRAVKSVASTVVVQAPPPRTQPGGSRHSAATPEVWERAHRGCVTELRHPVRETLEANLTLRLQGASTAQFPDRSISDLLRHLCEAYVSKRCSGLVALPGGCLARPVMKNPEHIHADSEELMRLADTINNPFPPCCSNGQRVHSTVVNGPDDQKRSMNNQEDVLKHGFECCIPHLSDVALCGVV